MKKSIVLLITLFFSFSMFAQTKREINGWMLKGVEAYKQNNYQEAISNLEKFYKVTYQQEESIKNEDFGILVSVLAKCYAAIGDFSKAVEYGTKALEFYHATGDSVFDNLLDNITLCFLSSDNNAIIAEYGTIVLGMLNESHPRYATFLSILSNAYSHLGNDAKAKEYEAKLRQIRQTSSGDNHPDDASSWSQTERSILIWGNMGTAEFQKGNYQEAVQYFEKMKEAFEKNNKVDEKYGMVLGFLVVCSYALDDDAKAMEYEEKLRQISQATSGDNHPDDALLWRIKEKVINIWGNKGADEFQEGNYQEAARHFEKIVDTFEKHNEEGKAYGDALGGLVQCYTVLGDYSKAMECAKKCVEVRKAAQGENHSDYASALTNLSALYAALGEYAKAVEYGIKAMEVFKSLQEEKCANSAISLMNLGNYFSALGDYPKAIEYTTKSIEIFKATPEEKQSYYATALNILAEIYSNLEDYSKAVEYGTMALEIRQATPGENPLEYASLLNCLSGYYSQLGDILKAVEYGTKALEIVETTVEENHPNYSYILENLANCYFLLNDSYSALEYEEKAMDIRKATLGENHPYFATSLITLATLNISVGNYPKGVECFKQGISIIYSNIIQQFTSLTTNLRASFWEKHRASLTDYYPGTVFYISSDPEIIADVYDKSALFAKGLLLTTETEMNKLIMESGDEEALGMFEELRAQRMHLQHLYETPGAERHVVDSLRQVADQLENKLVERSKVYGDFTRKLRTTWKDVQAALDKDEMAVEFLSIGIPDTDSTLVVALTLKKGDKAPKFIRLFEQSQLEALNDNRRFIRPEVTDLVWKPMQEELGGIHCVYFSPAGILHSIGIEYLPGMEQYDLRRLSTTREVIDLKERSRKATADNTMATLYGGIDYEASTNTSRGSGEDGASDDIAQSISRSISRNITRSISSSMRYAVDDDIDNALPGTMKEVENIRASFEEKNRRVSVLTGKEATEGSFKALSAHTPGILHIATHGFYYTETEKRKMDARMLLQQVDNTLGAAEKEDKALTRSGLLLAGANHALRDEELPLGVDDGILTAQEISKLDLRGLDLVVLSACETGKGDVTQGEGVFGLQRGFKKAGAGTIVMSLWKVDDAATEMMMTQFYKNLCNGMDKHAALQMAQRHLREYKDEKGNNPYDNPQFWAGFIILD